MPDLKGRSINFIKKSGLKKISMRTNELIGMGKKEKQHDKLHADAT